jgi:hypothetical protein
VVINDLFVYVIASIKYAILLFPPTPIIFPSFENFAAYISKPNYKTLIGYNVDEFHTITLLELDPVINLVPSLEKSISFICKPSAN